MQIAQVKQFIQDTQLPEAYTITLDNVCNGTCRVVMMRKLAEPKAEQTINDLVAGCKLDEEMIWRGWTFEPEFAWEFHKALAYAITKG